MARKLIYDSLTNRVRCKKEDKKKLDIIFRKIKNCYYSNIKEYNINLEEVRNNEN